MRWNPTRATSRNTPTKWNGWNALGNRSIRPQNWSLLFGILGYAILQNNHAMKLLSALSILVLLNGCVTIKDCAVAPKVEIKIEKQDNNDNKNSKDTEIKEKSKLETVKEIVEPGAQVVCRY